MSDKDLRHRVTQGAKRNVSVAIAAMCLVGLILAGFLAPLPHDPFDTNVGQSLAPPSGEHWFGTDRSGGDVFSRTVRAARLDLPLALIGTGLALVIGTILGLAASTKGRSGERLMRVLDGFQAFPILVLALALVALSGNRLEMVVVAIALINVPRYMRLIRSEVVSLRESRFIEAALACGAGNIRIMSQHVLPNIRGIVLVQTSLTAAHAIVVIATLSFLGIGITPPTPSWGSMIRDGAQNMTSGQWWMSLFPGCAIFVAVFCFNTIARTIGNRRRVEHGA